MRRAYHALLLCIATLLACGCSAFDRATPSEVIAHGAFAHLRIYRPRGPIRHLALVISGDGGWGSPVDAIASGLAARGTLVAGIDAREWLAVLGASGSGCVNPGAELADLSRYLKEQYPVPPEAPLLLGHSAGASLAYVSLAQGQPAQFAGALTLSFCADLDLARPLCPAATLREIPRTGGVRLVPAGALPARWTDLHGLEDRECPAAEARSFTQAVPGAGFVPLPGVGHSYRDPGRWWGAFLSTYDTLSRSP